ncbi:MAG: hypothetical protein ACU0HS_16235 [Paracoccus sp. (in: a-proteobacteria)]|uniref:hypothetical protein n=1 Tax=Paracoccus sp. TaxID=267 RepID=UPI004058134B
MERDPKQSANEVMRLILHSCPEMGLSPQAARQLVERCLRNQRSSEGLNAHFIPEARACRLRIQP